MEIIAKTLITNLTEKEMEARWAGVSLKPHEARLVDGLYPTACKTPADVNLMTAEVDAGKVSLVLITNLTVAGVDSVAVAQAALTHKVERQVHRVVESAKEREVAEQALHQREAVSRGMATQQEKEQLKISRTAGDKLKQGAQTPFRQATLNDTEPDAKLFRDTDPRLLADKPTVHMFGQTPEGATKQMHAGAQLALEAQALATKHQLTPAELSTIKGNGRGGRILGSDVQEYLTNVRKIAAPEPVAANA